MLPAPYPFPYPAGRQKAPAKRPRLSVLDLTLFKSDKKRAEEPREPSPAPAPEPAAPPVTAAPREFAPPPRVLPLQASPGNEDSMFVFFKLAVDALVEEKDDAAAVEAFCSVFSMLHKKSHSPACPPRIDASNEIVAGFFASEAPHPDLEAVDLADGDLAGLCVAIKQEEPAPAPPVHPPSSAVLQRFFSRLEPGSPLLASLSDRLGSHAYDVVSDALWKNPPVADCVEFAAQYPPGWHNVPSLPAFDAPCSTGEGFHPSVRHGFNSSTCASFRAHARPECCCRRDRCMPCFFETALRDLVARIASAPASAWDCVLCCRECGGCYCPFSVFALLPPPPPPPPTVIDVDEVMVEGSLPPPAPPAADDAPPRCNCTRTRQYAPPQLAGLGEGKFFFDMMLNPSKTSHIKGCPLHSSHKSGKKKSSAGAGSGRVGRPPKIKKEPL